LRGDFHPGFLQRTTAAVPLPPRVGWHRHGALTFVVEEGGGVSVAACTARGHTWAQCTCGSHPFRSPRVVHTPHFFTRKCKILGIALSKAVVCSSVTVVLAMGPSSRARSGGCAFNKGRKWSEGSEGSGIEEGRKPRKEGKMDLNRRMTWRKRREEGTYMAATTKTRVLGQPHLA
jgi:hypothetical protein